MGVKACRKVRKRKCKIVGGKTGLVMLKQVTTFGNVSSEALLKTDNLQPWRGADIAPVLRTGIGEIRLSVSETRPPFLFLSTGFHKYGHAKIPLPPYIQGEIFSSLWQREGSPLFDKEGPGEILQTMSIQFRDD
jgi:hypothetical protein